VDDVIRRVDRDVAGVQLSVATQVDPAVPSLESSEYRFCLSNSSKILLEFKPLDAARPPDCTQMRSMSAIAGPVLFSAMSASAPMKV